VARLTEKADRQLRATYAKLTAWQKNPVARHPTGHMRGITRA